jgi:epoxyqueuosine reductase
MSQETEPLGNSWQALLQDYLLSIHRSILCASSIPIYGYSVSVTVMDASWHQSDQAFDKLKQKALELGFTAIGVTDPDVSQHVPFLNAWLDAGFHGTMDWFQRNLELRKDPTQLAAGTQRIISVRLDYLPENTDCIKVLNDPDKAYISRYALGRDYHKLMRKRLKYLGDWFSEQIAPHGFRVFSDSAPILEKHLAEKAGLGWIGKHTLLLSRSAGSWFFLGELLTDYPLPISGESEDSRCGSCSACIDICPTDAFKAPYELDATKCVSYLTIEHRGPIPEEFRKPMGNRVFGCDDCQLVCPWNKYASVGDPDFRPRNELDKRQLIDLFQWSEEEFLEKTKGSPLRRAGYVKFLENLAIGLGNSEENISQTLSLLNGKLGAYGPTLDEHIQWAVKNLNDRASGNVSCSI